MFQSEYVFLNWISYMGSHVAAFAGFLPRHRREPLMKLLHALKQLDAICRFYTT